GGGPAGSSSREQPRDRSAADEGAAGRAGGEPPTDEATAGAPDDLLSEGRRHLLRGDLAGAIARFEAAARAAPRDARVHKQLGRAYMRAGRVARGIAAYRRYLALAPDAPDRAIVERIIAQHGG
ncbi:MAG TPA: tetratricopeptide repeat protein, partial [Sandaracinaceae bacterium LLY-WYZ-13_1]|nr:tetratricopeptide repeat protein [Sandaracinaceae bacterium LLY-WYZ-13_1]